MVEARKINGNRTRVGAGTAARSPKPGVAAASNARRVSPKPAGAAAAGSKGNSNALGAIVNQAGKSDEEKAMELVSMLQSQGGSMEDQMAQLLGMMGLGTKPVGQAAAQSSNRGQAASNSSRSPASRPAKTSVPSATIKAPTYPYEFTPLAKRKLAVKGVDFSRTDPVMHYMLNTAEDNFMPKQVVTP